MLGGVYDGISTRLADRAGFEVLFVGGFSIAASQLGEPDFGYVTQTEMADAARRICRLTERPVLVDADTGYGNPLNVFRTVELYANGGAAGLFLEDQVWPKRCGHMRGKQVVERAEWTAKLRAVLDARKRFGDLFLVARTDSRAVVGLEEAIERGRAARDLGADAVFVEAPESAAELERIGKAIAGPKVANMVEGGRTPWLGANELEEMGYALAIYPVTLLLRSIAAMRNAAADLAAEREGTAPRATFDETRELVGWGEYEKDIKRWE